MARVVAFTLALVSAVLAAPARAAPVDVLGRPVTLSWPPKQTAYVIPGDTGLLVELTGPGAFILELRSKKRGKRVMVDILDGEHLRSRNPIKLKPVGGGRHGYRFAALLAMKVKAGKHQYRLLVKGAELAVIITKRKKMYPQFAIRPFEDLRAAQPEELLVAAPEPPPETPPPEPIEPTVEPVTPEEASDEPPEEATIAMRDEDIFGAAGDTLVEEVQAGVPEAVALTEEDAAVRLAIADDILAIGGRLFSLVDVAYRPASDTRQLEVGSTSLLDVYLDARPLELVRGYARGRLRFVPTLGQTPPALGGGSVGTAAPTSLTAGVNGGEEIQVLLDQLWLKISLGRILFITFGQQPIKWGTGRFWNPTDFVNSVVRQPLAIVDERTGVPLLKLHLPIEALGWNFYAIAMFDGIDSIEDIGGAVRAELVFSTVELAFSAATRRDAPIKFGADISAGFFGWNFRGEVALQTGVKSTFWRGDLDLDPDRQRFPVGYQRPDDLILQFVLGAEVPISYGQSDTLIVGLEYFYNDAGYENSDLYTWMLIRGDFTPLFVGRQYAGLYVAAPYPFIFDDTTINFTTLANVSDGSWLLRLDYRVLLFSVVNLTAFVTGHLGNRGEFRLGINIPAQTGALGEDPSLARGIRLPPAWLTWGLGLLIEI